MNMEITNSCQVKASFNDDLRRFSVLRDAPFSHLLGTVVRTFELAPNAPVVIKYTDNEGEQITMSSDAELREAMQISSGILRIHVGLRPVAPSAPVPEIDDVTMRGPGEEGLENLSLYPKWGAPPHGGFRGGFHGRGGFGPHGGFGRGGFAHRGGPHGHHGGPYGHHGGPHGGPHARHAPPPFFAGEPSMFQAPPMPADGFAHPFPPQHPHAMPAFYGPWGARHHHHAQKEQMRMWKEQKKEWKKQWETMSKEEREAIKAHKKEMKRQWRAAHHECKDRNGRLVARHVKDITIADGTELAAGTPFSKTWRIRNEGEEWPAGCRLLWISRLGDRLNAPESVPVPVEGPVPSQQEIEISVDLVAPVEPGRYTCFFRLATAEGVKFGQRMWVSIVVPGSSSSSSDDDARMTKYGNTAEMIEAMGFSVKRKHIVRMLAKHDGDVDKVVRVLAKREKGCKDKKERKERK